MLEIVLILFAIPRMAGCLIEIEDQR